MQMYDINDCKTDNCQKNMTRADKNAKTDNVRGITMKYNKVTTVIQENNKFQVCVWSPRASKLVHKDLCYITEAYHLEHTQQMIWKSLLEDI